MSEIPKPTPISVVIPYHKNLDGLSVLLATLQAQIVLPHQIIVIDTSADRSGLAMCRKYQTTVPIKCEVAPVGIYEAWNKGIEMSEGDHVLIINDDVLLPLNVIDQLTVAVSQTQALAIVPETPPREHSADYVNTDYPWWSEPMEYTDQTEEVFWLPGFCFMLTAQAVKEVGLFDLRFKVWFGDDDYQTRLHDKANDLGIPAILKIKTVYVYHYGGLSYAYQSKAVQKLIDTDRKAYQTKYGHRKPEVKQS